MEGAERNHLRRDDNAVREHLGVVSFSIEETSGHNLGSTSRINTTVKRKSCRDSFLVWVGFTRDQASSELQRRTCPLIGCEKSFKDSQIMRRHVYKCLPQSKGLYRCYICGNEEKVGRYHTKTCPEQSKDRFVKLANPVRLVKRFLSRQALKNRSHLQQSDVPHPGLAELNFDPIYPLAELNANYFNDPVEMPGDGCAAPLAELGDFNSTCISQNQAIQQISPPEPSEGSGSKATSAYYVPPQCVAAELPAPAPITGGDSFPRQASICTPPPQETSENEVEVQWHAQPPVPTRPLRLNIHPVHQGLQQRPQSVSTSKADHDTSWDDFVSPISPVAHEPPHFTNTPVLSPGQSSTYTDELFLPSDCSVASRNSTPNTSMSSFDLNTKSQGGYFPSSTPILEELESGLIYGEPEELDSLPIAASNNVYAPIINDLFHWPPAPNGFVFSQDVPSAANLQIQETTKCPFEVDTSASAQPSPALHHYSTEPFTPNTPFSLNSKLRCICGHEFTGGSRSSNFKRHQKSCPQLPGNNKDSKPHKCTFPRCGKRYSRSDNLRVHQKGKGHTGSVDLAVRFTSMPPPILEHAHHYFELEGRELGPKRRRTE